MAGGHGPHLSLLKITWDISAHMSRTKAYCEEGRTEEEWEMLSCSQEERNWNDFQHPVITRISQSSLLQKTPLSMARHCSPWYRQEYSRSYNRNGNVLLNLQFVKVYSNQILLSTWLKLTETKLRKNLNV